MHRLHLLGLNHTTAPLEVRERLAFNPAQRAVAMADFRRRFPECEAVLLSTCNRVELYTARQVHGHPRAEEMAEFLCGFHAVPGETLRPHLYHRSERDMVEHLFTVASSLDSMVLGETQILGQVREAYDAAREQACAGPLLNPLFQRAIAVGRQVMRETPLTEGRLSIARVAVDYAGRIFDHWRRKNGAAGAAKLRRFVTEKTAGVQPRW
jgi:glutamyl-tRNA reductase